MVDRLNHRETACCLSNSRCLAHGQMGTAGLGANRQRSGEDLTLCEIRDCRQISIGVKRASPPSFFRPVRGGPLLSSSQGICHTVERGVHGGILLSASHVWEGRRPPFQRPAVPGARRRRHRDTHEPPVDGMLSHLAHTIGKSEAAMNILPRSSSVDSMVGKAHRGSIVIA